MYNRIHLTDERNNIYVPTTQMLYVRYLCNLLIEIMTISSVPSIESGKQSHLPKITT